MSARAKAKLETAIHEATQLVRNHRAKVVSSHPFFGALLLKQKLVASYDVETMATNGKELFYNPDYVNQQRSEYLTFDVAHEALHPALGHHVRRGNRRFDWWNQACDYIINPILRESGFHVPPDALMRPDLEGMNAERAYKVIAGENAQPPGPGGEDEDGAPQPGEQPEPPPQPKPAEQSQEDGDDGEGEGDGDQDEQPQDGSGDGQGDDSGEGQGQPVQSFGGTGAVLDAPVETEAERVAEEQEWTVALTQAANLAAASKAGNLPADLIRQIEAITEPKANWREILRRFMDQFAKEDYSWSAPNRRFIGEGLYLPSMRSEKLPPILFVVDASSSMPADALEQAGGELQSIIDELQPEYLDVIWHDTDVRGQQRFEPDEQVNLKIRAGGGTKFAPVCDWINNADEEYAVVVWFTDLEAWDWDECDAPDIPLVWIDWNAKENPQYAFGDECVPLQDDWS